MKQCMIVDDSRIVRKVARRILEGLELDVAEADDGAAALELCRKQMPDAILLDGHALYVVAADFLRALRRENGGTKPLVVLCTIETDVALITEAVTAGANDYLLKPYDHETLRTKLTDIGLLS